MQQDDYRATLLIIASLAAANLTGLMRQAVLAHQLGVGPAADIYLIAFSLPEFIFIALPIVLSPAFLPLFARRRVELGESNAWRFGLQVSTRLLVALSATAILAGLTAPIYLGWLSPGFTGTQRLEAVRATQLMLPATVVQGMVVLFGAALQVYRHFARPALSTAVYNLTFCAALLLLPLPWIVGRAAWGILLGSVVALLLQAARLWKYRPRPLLAAGRPAQTLGSLSPDVRRMARATGWMAAGYAAHHAILLVDRAMATALGAGRAASLQYAYHLALVIGQVSGLAVSTALFPRLVEQTAGEDTSGVRTGLRDALRFVLLLGLPAACALVLLRTPTIELFLKRGAFGATATTEVARPLIWYTIAVVADALCQPLWRVVYSRDRPRAVLAINGVQTLVRLALNFALTPAFGYNGLALSAAIGLALQAGVLSWWVRRQIGPYVTRAWWQDTARIVLATAAAAGAIAAGVYPLKTTPPIVVLSVSGLLGSLAYLFVLKISGLRIAMRVPAGPPRNHA